MNTMRQRTVAAAVVAIATLGLTGCQDSAPPVAKSTTTSTSSSSSSDTSSTTSSDTSTESSTETSSSTESSSTSSSSGGGGVSQSSAAGQCNNTSSFYIVKGAGTKIVKYGETQKVKGSGDADVDLTISKGEAKDGGTSYPYDEGTQALIFDVKYKVTSADGYLITTPLSFSLIDENGRNCHRATSSSNNVVLGKDYVDVESLRGGETTDYSGKIVFVVPKGKDYSKYTLLWNDDYDGGTEAGFGWQG